MYVLCNYVYYMPRDFEYRFKWIGIIELNENYYYLIYQLNFTCSGCTLHAQWIFADAMHWTAIDRDFGVDQWIHIIFKLTAFRWIGGNGCSISDITFERKCFICSFVSFFRAYLQIAAAKGILKSHMHEMKMKITFQYWISHNDAIRVHRFFFLFFCIKHPTPRQRFKTRKIRANAIYYVCAVHTHGTHITRLRSAHLNDLWSDSFQAINGPIHKLHFQCEKLRNFCNLFCTYV